MLHSPAHAGLCSGDGKCAGGGAQHDSNPRLRPEVAVLPKRQKSQIKFLDKQQSVLHHGSEHAAAQVHGNMQDGLRSRRLRLDLDTECMVAGLAGYQEVTEQDAGCL